MWLFHWSSNIFLLYVYQYLYCVDGSTDLVLYVPDHDGGERIDLVADEGQLVGQRASALRTCLEM